MRACGFCKFLDGDKCKKGYPIERFEKLEGYKRPKYCTKKVDSVKKEKESKDSFLNKKLDNLWSKIVRSKGECELCGRKPPEVILHAHHIFSRKKYSTRYDLDNSVCLCMGCHLYKAHKDIQEFSDWVCERLGKERLDALRIKAHTIVKYTKEDKLRMITELEQKIDKLK